MPEPQDQSCPASGRPPLSGELRLITFNIQNRIQEPWNDRRTRLEGIASLVQSQSPDVVCLQECLFKDFAFLKQELDARHSGFTPRDDGNRLGEGNPIFSLGDRWSMLGFQSFWLSATPAIPSRSWGSAHPRIASVMNLHQPGEASRTLHVVNVHLDHRSALARRKSLVLIRRELGQRITSPRDEVLVCGDFNIRPQRLQQTGFLGRDLDPEGSLPLVLEDAANCGSPCRNMPTFRGLGKFGLFRGRIDYCLYSTHLKCTHYSVIDPVLQGRWLSDHRLVQASFACPDSQTDYAQND